MTQHEKNERRALIWRRQQELTARRERKLDAEVKFVTFADEAAPRDDA